MGTERNGPGRGAAVVKLPCNLEAERSVLGAILLDNEAFHPAIELIGAGDFFLDSHRRIFARMTGLSEANQAIDLVTLSEELERSAELEAAGGSAYLSSLVDGVPRVTNIAHYARIVKEKALLRNLIHACDNIMTQALQAEEQAGAILERGAAALADLRVENARSRQRAASGGVVGADLLREIKGFITRFVVLPPKTVLPVALWVMGTYTFREFAVYPYLAVLGPTRRVGKTRLLQVLELLTHNPRRAVGISEAALFRLVEAEAPTLLLDEAEFLRGRSERAEALRQLLNAGHGEGACVFRCVGKEFELRPFNVFCPKALACIGSQPDTIADRSITIPMQRKLSSEKVQRLSVRRVGPEAEALQARIAGWVEGRRAEIAGAYEGLDIPFLEDDRAADNFEPLFALLFVADHSRFEELRASAEALVSTKISACEDDDLRLRLLADVRRVWPEAQASIFTSELLVRLRQVDDSPWAHEIELTPRKMARWLRGFDAQPRTIRIGTTTAKGYLWSELHAAIARYLTVDPSQRSQCNVLAGVGPVSDPSQEEHVTDAKRREKPVFMGVVTDVTDKPRQVGS